MRKVDGYLLKSKLAVIEPKKKMSKRADISGRKFGRLLAVSSIGLDKYNNRFWKCDCDCGGKVVVISRELYRGHTKSCGCLYDENLEKLRMSAGANKLPYGFASRNELLASYKKSARLRGYEWDMSDERYREIIDGECVYCGDSKSMERKPNKNVNGEFMYTGIDRVDNTKGYTDCNTVPCCWVCNRAKGAMGLQQFHAWIEKITQYNKGASL